MKLFFTWSKNSLVLIICFFLLNAIPFKKEYKEEVTISKLKFINELVIPNNKQFRGTTVGGISGIDYDRERGVYYLISDDRSTINAARFYKVKIHLAQTGIDSVQFLAVQSMLQPNGKIYPSARQSPRQATDPEAIRFNAKTKELVWTSEGERIIKAADTILINPAINIIRPDGKFIGSFPLPANLLMLATSKGPRQNGVLEGITFGNDYSTLYATLEEPLYEDGPKTDVIETDSWVRIYHFDVATKTNTAQYAYKLEPVAYPATPENEFKINGVSEILSLGNKHLLVVERSFSTGRLNCTIKIFQTDLSQADNIIKVPSLKDTPPVHAVVKNLVLNMDSLGIYIDNIEGVTFGPDLPNGHKTLIFISDNNFMQFEKTQLLFFEVIP